MEYTTWKANIHGCRDVMHMGGLPILTALSVHDTDEGVELFLLDNEGIIQTIHNGSITSVT